MKHLLLASAALLLSAASHAQHAPVPDVEILPIPEGVASVSPAQGFVDISPNANPLGVSEITLTFPSAPEVNTSCTGVAECYYNGSAEPIATATVANAVVDNMGYPAGAISFGKNLTSVGTYHVEIPEGFWTVGGALSPAVSLNYEISRLYVLSPQPGVVPLIDELVLTFPGADNVTRNPSAAVEFYQGMTNYTLMTSMQSSGSGNTDRVVMTFASADGLALDFLTNPGMYIFHCEADAFNVIKYGPNYPSDLTDYSVEGTPEIVVHYNVPSFPAPAISPKQGELESFENFSLTVPSTFTLWMVNDKVMSHIYSIDEDGVYSPDPVCYLTGSKDPNAANVVNLSLINKYGKPLESVTPAPGKYVLRLADDLFSGQVNGNFVSSVAFEYFYTVKNSDTGVGNVITPDAANAPVFNLQGHKVRNNASDLNALPAGIYIVGGKKVLVK